MEKNILTDIDMNMNMLNSSILIDGCEKMGITLTSRQIQQFILFYRRMYEKNQVMNLTTVTKWEEVQSRHFLDSLLLSRITDLTSDIRILDLGTGAGLDSPRAGGGSGKRQTIPGILRPGRIEGGRKSFFSE